MVSTELVLLLTAVVCARGQDRTVNPCTSRKTCGDCIVVDKSCGWCITENYGDGKISRCDLVQNLILNGCDPASIQNPENNLNLVANAPVVDGDIDTRRDAIQIQPQEVHITMRPNNPINLKVMFRQAANYPVDLYYLMDLSNSMEDDKDNLAKLGTKIAESMSKITKNFKLGFGSFVDKVVMPYVSTVPEKLISPCRNCVAPYGFRNTLSLTSKTERFAYEVLRAPVSGNLDGPEGGFDAIMQSIMCQDIGWRAQSRKMVLFSTDAGFHYAGDGKLGGIVKPNDGRCHLDRYGNYTQSIYQDYPSISQIAATIEDKNVNLIFAVTKDQVPVYESLRNLIEGSTVGELADDSANIVQLVQENYNKITSKVELNTQNAELFSVIFKSKCLGRKMNETNICDNLKIGDNVTFDVSIKIKDCPQDPAKRRQMFTIYPVGLGDKIEITVDLVCECECEKPQFEVRNSPKCSAGNGTYECGQCSCNEGRSGKLCECDGSETQGDELEKQCIAANSTVVCSGRGECLCGECECNPRSSSSQQKYSGLFCQCDDFSCDYHNGVLCGGVDHGLCDCGICKCETGFSGKACGCPTSNATCMASTGELCNGKGTCECGRCQCNTTTLYRGPTCEDCPTCPGKCRDNKACVQCTAFRTGELSKEECLAQCNNIETVPDVRESEGVKMCQFKDEDDCNFFFTYEYDANNVLQIKAQRDKECPATVNILAIVLGVIGGIVAIGLAMLLIWKLLTTIHDRREFAKFEKERQNAKWDTGENPIYKQATSTFKNPTYGGK